MDRRKAIRNISLALGGTAVAGSMVMQHGCKISAKKYNDIFDVDQVAMMDEIAETIIPKTDTPGAKDAAVGAFIAIMVQDTLTNEKQQIFLEGLVKIEEAAKKKFHTGFMKLNGEQRTILLTEIDQEMNAWNARKKPEDPDHYFQLMKGLTVQGYFTSEPGATKALRYLPVPGKYEGCIDYQPGDKAWAT